MTPPSPERALRETLWIGHGHVGLYGDDGEMQCSRCRADYKRDPLDALAKVALTAAHAQGRASGLEEAAIMVLTDAPSPETVAVVQRIRVRAAEEARRG